MGKGKKLRGMWFSFFCPSRVFLPSPPWQDKGFLRMGLSDIVPEQAEVQAVYYQKASYLENTPCILVAHGCSPKWRTRRDPKRLAPIDYRALRKGTKIQSRVSFLARVDMWRVATAPALIPGSSQGTCNTAATS